MEKMTRNQLERAERNARFGIFRRAGLKYIQKRHNPNLGGVVQSYSDSLYDSVTFAAGAAFAKTILFQVGIGQGSGPKTLAQTNMTQSGGILPNPYRFTIWGMGCLIENSTIPADIDALTKNISATLLINNHPYQQGPLVKFPAGRGWQMVAGYNAVVGAGTGATGTSGYYGVSEFSTSNGSLDPKACYMFDIPITIEQGEQFQLVLNPETAVNLSPASVGTTNNVTAYNPSGVGTTITWFLDGNIEVGVS